MQVPAAALEHLRRLHAVVDQLTAPLAEKHGPRLRCRVGCSDCCVDELSVFEVEAARIVEEFPEVLAGSPHPPGACAMLDERGACRIYAARPYVCRTQGLPLRWLEERRGRVVERRDICPLNAEGPAIGTLDKDDCWALGPVEDRLARLQEGVDGGQGRRVGLRSLFGEHHVGP